MPHGVGIWLVAATFASVLAFCAVPTPLYAIYQQRDGFPTIIVTAVFAAYAVGVMLSLYLAGHVSDWLGRRRIILISLLIEIVAAVLFLYWNDVTGLFVARFVSGIGIGLIAATATAHVSELAAHTGRSPGHATLIATFANLGGIGVGALIGGLFATWSPEPLITPYVSFLALFIVEALFVAFVPETVKIHVKWHTYRPQRLSIPAGKRGVFWSAAAAAFGSFAVFGALMGLSSTFLVGILGQHSHLLAGSSPFLVFFAAATAQALTTRMPLRAQIALSIVLAILGLTLLATAALASSLPLFLTADVITGAGIGILFRGALLTGGKVAIPERRGETLAVLFLISYAGMTLPPIAAATALMVWPATDVLVGIAATAAVIVVTAGSRILRADTTGAPQIT